MLQSSCTDRDGASARILLVADGMGSCARAREGSEGLCTHFNQVLTRYLAGHRAADVTHEVCREAVLSFFEALDEPREHGTTLLAAIVSDRDTHLFQCGDGDIFFASVDDPTAFAAFLIPEEQSTNYSNSVYPADIAVKRNKDLFRTISTPQRLALMSDGVSPFFVDGRGMVHQGAAQRLFTHFEALEFGEGEANEKLSNTLSQEHFQSIHDDRSALLFYQ